MLINPILINWKNVPINLYHLKSKVDRIDVNKLVPAPIDLNKLIDVVKNDIVKIDVYIATSKILQIIYLPILTLVAKG